MSDKWEVVHDRDSLPMIQSPAGSIMRLQFLKDGQWVNYSPSLNPIINHLAEGAELLRQTNRAINPKHNGG